MKHKLEQLQGTFDHAVELAVVALSSAQASAGLLELLGLNLGCDWGTLWKVDSVTHQLCPIATWSANSLETSKLKQDTRFRKLSLSEGNAGHVWRSQKPIWTTDVVRDMCLPRSLDAAFAGLRGGIWFAIKTEHAMYGVIELLGRNISSPDAELLAGIEILGIRLGRVIAVAVDSH
jgi:hypothetical protein